MNSLPKWVKKKGTLLLLKKMLALYANTDIDITDDVIKRYNKLKKQ